MRSVFCLLVANVPVEQRREHLQLSLRILCSGLRVSLPENEFSIIEAMCRKLSRDGRTKDALRVRELTQQISSLGICSTPLMQG